MTLLDFIPSLQHAAPSRIDPAVWPRTARVDDYGRLCVGGVRLSDVADEFGTPACVLDEDDFRYRARRHRTVLKDAEIVYAGTSLLTIAVARWVREEGLGLSVCSGGELATALAGGVDPARIILDGNAKTPNELRDAVAVGVGRIVVDSPTEIALLACDVSRPQRVLLHVTPDVDIHGHLGVIRIVHQPLLDLVGLHCRIGSPVADASRDGGAIHRMIAAMADIRAAHAVTLCELNIVV
jgi:diaminopimelate decarboxylase